MPASAATLPSFPARRFFRSAGAWYATISWPARLLALLIAGTSAAHAAEPAADSPTNSIAAPSSLMVITNMSQVLSHVRSATVVSLPVRLEATVTEADVLRGFVDMVDDTDMGRIELDLKQIPMAAGQRIRLEGTVLFGNGRAVFENSRTESNPPLVDNDGRHSRRELYGVARLNRGKHRLRVTYFQFSGPRLFNVRYSGPGTTKRPIPATALFHAVDPAGGEREYVPGVKCEYYPRASQTLPDFAEWKPARTGVVPDFSLPAFVRSNAFALQFTGFLQIEREGDYTFYLESDDGSQLFLEPETPARVEVLGLGDLVELRPARLGRPLPREEAGRMLEVAGTVTFISEDPENLLIELSDETAFLQLRVPRVSEASATDVAHLLGSRVRTRGRSGRVLDVRGEGVLGTLTLSGLDSLYLERVPESLWRATPPNRIDTLAANRTPMALGTLVQVHGKVLRQVPGSALVIGDDTASIEVRSNQRELVPAGSEVRAVGCWQPSSPGMVLSRGFYQVRPDAAAPNQPALPVLNSAIEVHSLSAEEAARRYPVRLKGVVTSVNPVRIQDATRGAFMERSRFLATTNTRIGELFEIEGVTTAGRFAPNVEPRAATRLGPAQLPKPIRPTYEQLMSLSDTTQWAELEGVIQSILRISGSGTKTCDLSLATRGGSVMLRMLVPPGYDHWTNTLDDLEVRVRGTISALFNEQRQIQGAYLSVPSPAYVCIVRRGPADSFSLPPQPITALMQFDPQGSSLHRVKVEGQITHIRDATWFLMDGANALTFRPRTPPKAALGDRVAVSGYQDMSEKAPVLREALVQKKGPAPLPTPPVCTVEELMTGRLNNARVRLVANVLAVRTNGTECVFELQSDLRSFQARQEIAGGKLPDIPNGSLVELTGVCAGRVSKGMFGQTHGTVFTALPLDSFDLLLNSPGDIRLLKPPPRWTLREALALITALAASVLVAVLWIYLLRRRVAERTAQLQAANKELEAFSYSVSHDLRAPLRSIDGFSKALLEDYAGQIDAEGRDSLQRVRQASQQMETLIDDMLMLSQVSRHDLHRTAVDLSNLAESITSELRATDPERRIQFLIAPGLSINADPNLLRIALQNLLSNAWKYTSKHPTARVEVGSSRQNGQSVYFVRDDGAGFDMAFAGKLFGAFQRLHPAAEFHGTGVGLTTAQRIIHRHGGRIWAEGAVEKGATFYFTIQE